MFKKIKYILSERKKINNGWKLLKSYDCKFCIKKDCKNLCIELLNQIKNRSEFIDTVEQEEALNDE
jgi:hypothetical protein